MIEVVRGGIVESRHHVHVAVADYGSRRAVEVVLVAILEALGELRSALTLTLART